MTTENARTIKFAHIWLVSPLTATVGRATMAFFADGLKVTAAVAFCTPQDRYYRSEGRVQALRAMNEGKTFEISVPEPTEEKPWAPASYLAQYLTALLWGKELVPTFKVPKWAQNTIVMFNGEISTLGVIQYYRPTFDCKAKPAEYVLTGTNGFKAGPFTSREQAEKAGEILAGVATDGKNFRIKRAGLKPVKQLLPPPVMAFSPTEIA